MVDFVRVTEFLFPGVVGFEVSYWKMFLYVCLLGLGIVLVGIATWVVRREFAPRVRAQQRIEEELAQQKRREQEREQASLEERARSDQLKSDQQAIHGQAARAVTEFRGGRGER